MKKRIYITEPNSINTKLVKDKLGSEWDIIEGTPNFTGNSLESCSALLIRSATTITASIKNKFPVLRHIIRVGVGIDNIDMDFCRQEGISVYNAPGANADAVSDYVVGMMLYALRKLNLLTQQDVKTWNRFKFTGRSMAGRTIGIIGFGNIGKQIFTKLQGFHCKSFFIYDPFIKEEDLPMGVVYMSSVEDVLHQSDIVTLHVPLIPSTKYLINKDNLSRLREDSILINASRGGIVNEADITQYMQTHNLIYIADTVENEPQVSETLLMAQNAIVTPHIASLTKEADDNVIVVALNNFISDRAMNR